MREFDPAFAAHLASGATTLCWCWVLERTDGTVLGFTDHDRPVNVDGVVCEPETGLSATAIETASGFAVDNTEVAGVLDSARIAATDLENGLYDDATVSVYRVNWQDPASCALLHVANLGEVTRSGQGFTAELRGLAQVLNVEKGRLFQYACDADLGDARCNVNLADSAFSGSGTIATTTDSRSFTASGIDAFAVGWFAHGSLTWTSGANAGAVSRIKRHELRDGEVRVELWDPPAGAVAPGDGFDVVAGCDKTAPTCRDRFANLVNYRGFPHMPGNDFLFAYPGSGDTVNDGGSLGHE
ncbi:MAG: DUF2163 domain-containing protein [Rhodobiaceae bacterium]|nr:DUF2163 domain-containing protein [Rhodobiaceae bacterium]MCC0042293.1 DUF2163 domain-containing protein [Rhodobiaceae bacterium]